MGSAVVGPSELQGDLASWALLFPGHSAPATSNAFKTKLKATGCLVPRHGLTTACSSPQGHLIQSPDLKKDTSYLPDSKPHLCGFVNLFYA